MKNKKNKKDPTFINSEIDESILNELKDLESIASEINSNIDQEILDEIESQQEIMDVIESEQEAMLKELQPELDELKEREKILDEILEKETVLQEELEKHESEISELIIRYSETMKDLVNPQEELKEFNDLIDKSDKNFYSFAEAMSIENEISKEVFEVTPDVLKESVLGKTVIKNGINEKKFSFSNLLDGILPNFLNFGVSSNTSYFALNRIVAGLSLSVLFVTLLFLQNNPPILFRGEAPPLISIETANDKIVIKNKEYNNIELILMNLDGMVLNQSILKDSINVIDPIKGTKSYRILISSVDTEATLVDTVINFD